MPQRIYNLKFTSGLGVSLARFLKDSNDVFVAWGTGNASWYTVHTDTVKTFDALDVILTGENNIINVVVKSSDSQITYVEDVDYTIDVEDGQINRLPSGNIPAMANVKVTWTGTAPTVAGTETQLLGEVGRRKATEVSYVTPDIAGDITMQNDTSKFSRSLTPTPFLYVRADFAPENAPTSTIKEFAVYSHTVRQSGVDLGQQYLLPAEVLDKGAILLYSIIEPIIRSNLTAQTIDVVLPL